MGKKKVKLINAKYKRILFTMAFVLAIFISYSFISLSQFPEEINILKNKQNNIKFNLPFKATVDNESLPALKINNNSVDENINIDLSRSFTVSSEKEGKADMYIKALGIPIKKIALNVVKPIELAPWGITAGVEVKTEGVMVLGTGKVSDDYGESHDPSEGKLKSGDIILYANDKKLHDKTHLMEIIEGSDKGIGIKLKRGEEIIETTIKPVKSAKDNVNKIGVWVRDTTQGIGTITYYNPENNKFAALGHGIVDVDTKDLMPIAEGELMHSKINSVKKGQPGEPGELVGDIDREVGIGKVYKNTNQGIYGQIDLDKVKNVPTKLMETALQSEIHKGPATILSNVYDDEIKEYDIYIESVNKFSSDHTKGLILRITDPALLSKTNGIVQGMSGSPIIQDGKLIGAVTHVFVQDPTKGYGVFIENMIDESNE
jgi:stage IV sporulation protein B